MKGFRIITLFLVAIVGVAPARPATRNEPASHSDKDRLLGAWHLDSIDGPDGKPVSDAPKGMLIYTPDGHISVQLMYAKTSGVRSNEYVRDGYEASFGSYDVDEARHLVTHHVQGSITGDLLVGKDLPRMYRFSAEGHLVIRSAHPEERWSVTWVHY